MISWFWLFGAFLFMVWGMGALADHDTVMAVLWTAGSVSYGALWAQEM
jgi:hypothetical protein